MASRSARSSTAARRASRSKPGDIQSFLDKRKPGQSRFTTQRRESDEVKILSGVFTGDDGRQVTTGTPIALMIENTDQRSKDYGEIADKYRPGHADYVYDAKYGVRDYRGGGRSSARETAARVAAGAIARKVIAGVTIRGALGADRPAQDRARAFRLGGGRAQSALLPGRAQPPNSGRIISTTCARTAPPSARWWKSSPRAFRPGWGAPVYGKLDADLAAAMMSINAVKGVEIGAGFAAAQLTGEENADEMRAGRNGPKFLSNNAGGVLGGISTGQPVVVRFAVKPTSSILTPRRTIDRYGKETDIVTKGRHDPCVGIRAVPVGEAMMACVLADHFLRHRGQMG